MYIEISVNISRLYAELEAKSRKYDSKTSAQVIERSLEQHINEIPRHKTYRSQLPRYSDQKKLILTTNWMKRSQTQKFQNVVDSLGQRPLVSSYFSRHYCFIDTVKRYELLALFQYVSAVELPTMVFKIIYEFLSMSSTIHGNILFIVDMWQLNLRWSIIRKLRIKGFSQQVGKSWRKGSCTFNPAFWVANNSPREDYGNVRYYIFAMNGAGRIIMIRKKRNRMIWILHRGQC